MTRALIVVDVQKDFCEGGSLAVVGGNNVAESIASFIRTTRDYYEEIVFTKDWHKPLPDDNGGHFSDNPDFVDSWPVHCLAGTRGAAFHDAIRDIGNDYPTFFKGFGRPDYSGFQGTHNGQSLRDYLDSKGVVTVGVVGIAGDYCVRATAMDAVKEGYDTYVLPSLVVSVRGEEATWETVNMVEQAQR